MIVMKIKHKLTMSVIQLETIFKIHRLQKRKKNKHLVEVENVRGICSFLYMWHKRCGKWFLIEAAANSAVVYAVCCSQGQETDRGRISLVFLATGSSAEPEDLDDKVAPRER